MNEENLRKDLTYSEKTATSENDVKLPIDGQNLFDTIVDAKRINAKVSRKT